MRLVLGSGQRPVGELVAEGMAKKVAGDKCDCHLLQLMPQDIGHQPKDQIDKKTNLRGRGRCGTWNDADGGVLVDSDVG